METSYTIVEKYVFDCHIYTGDLGKRRDGGDFYDYEHERQRRGQFARCVDAGEHQCIR